jgi:hypothetical protein
MFGVVMKTLEGAFEITTIHIIMLFKWEITKPKLPIISLSLVVSKIRRDLSQRKKTNIQIDFNVNHANILNNNSSL